MSSVDSRIVEMTFDNKGFESGVKKTLSSLAELKSALNFKSVNSSLSSSLSSINKQTSQITKNLNLSEVKSSIDSTNKSMATFGSGFNISNIQSKISSLVDTISGLKKHFNFSDSTKSLSDLGKAANKIDFSPLANSIDDVKNRFNNMGIVGMTVVQNLTTQIMQAGSSMIKALSLTPLIDGFQEYETQMDAVQTILANTSSKGTTLQQVNSALDTLNTYADKTIYNFTQMTKNIGTFTAAGVDLQTSVNSIQGIANLAAVSGSTSLQASTAMYQLSQAIAAGTVKLMDWNSVVNAGMGGEVFQNALIRTSEHLNTGAKAAIEAEGSFRESLSTGWLTVDVLTETLEQFALTIDTAEDYNEVMAQLVAQGYTEEEAKQIADMAKTAMDAATKVKTFTQLLDTLKEALGSGWAQSWRIIIGDFGEAKELWTEVSDVLSNAINETANARNDLLSGGLQTGWQQLLRAGIADEEGYIETTKQVAREHGVAIDDLITQNGSFEDSLKDGWANSDILAESLHRVAEETKNWSNEEIKNKGYTKDQIRNLQQLDENVQNGTVDLNEYISVFGRMSGRQNIIEGLKTAFSNLSKVMSTIKEAFREVFPATTAEQLYDLTVNFKEFTEQMQVSDEGLDKIKRTFKGLFSILDIGKNTIKTVFNIFKDFFASEGVSQFVSFIGSLMASIGDLFTSLDSSMSATSGSFSGFTSLLSGFLGTLSNALGQFSLDVNPVITIIGQLAKIITDTLGGALSWLSENFSLGDVLTAAGIASLLQAVTSMNSISTSVKKVAKSIREFLKDLDSGGVIADIKESLVGLFTELGTSLRAFTTMVSSASLLIIAVSITLLVKAIKQLSELNISKTAVQIPVLAASIAILIKAFKAIVTFIKGYDKTGMITAAASLLIMALAMKEIAKAVTTLGQLGVGQAVVGLASLYAVLKMLTSFMNKTSLDKSSSSSAIVLLALAVSLRIIASAIKSIGELNWEQLGVGLAGCIVTLAALTAVNIALTKFSGDGDAIAGAAAILIMSVSLIAIAKAISMVAEYNWSQLGPAVLALGLMLAELMVVNLALTNFSGDESAIQGAAAILIMSVSLIAIGQSISMIANYSWSQLGPAILALGLVLAELMVVNLALTNFSGDDGSAIAGAAAILIMSVSLIAVAQSLSMLVGHSWDEMLPAMGAIMAVLAEMAIVNIALANFSGVMGLAGAASILIMSASLLLIGQSLTTVAQLSWEQVENGLLGLGAALIEVGVVAAAMGSIGPVAIVGAASMLIASASLGQVADALKKFGEMSWDEITRGLTAMGAALTEIAFGSLMNTLSGIGAASLSAIVEPLGALADSVKKWENVSTPDDLGESMGRVADGVGKFMFSGWGADALSTLAEPLGTLAESMKKWKDVDIPDDIADKMGHLADGVGKFTFSGMSAGGISAICEPLGNLADAVNKWKDVSVPDKIQDHLTHIANGIAAFTFDGVAGDTMLNIAEPFGTLAESVKKWKDAEVPENIQSNLTQIANGIASFTVAVTGAAVLPGIPEPLQKLGEVLGNWPELGEKNVSGNISDLATAILKYTDLATAVGVIRDAGDALTNLANGVTLAASASFETVGTNITTFSATIQSIPATLTTAIDSISTALVNLSTSISTQAGLITGSFNSMLNQSLECIYSTSGSFATAGMTIAQALGDSLSTTLSIQGASVSSIMLSITSDIINVGIQNINSNISNYTQAGMNLMQGLASGLRNGVSLCVQATSGVGNQCLSDIRGNYSGFYSAGYYLMQGLENGIWAGRSGVINAAIQVATETLQATKNALDEASPSKATTEMGVFYSQGLLNGIVSLEDKVADAGADVGLAALDALNDSFSAINSGAYSGLQPMITPVISGAGLASLQGLTVSRSVMLNAEYANAQISDPLNNLRTTISNDNLKIMRSNEAVTEKLDAVVGYLTDELGNTISTNAPNLVIDNDAGRMVVDTRLLQLQRKAAMNRG